MYIVTLPYAAIPKMETVGSSGSHSIFFTLSFGLFLTETEHPTQLAHHVGRFIGITNFDMW
jgi:hypothetical protein